MDNLLSTDFSRPPRQFALVQLPEYFCLRSLQPLLNEISKMSDISSSFRKNVCIWGLYTYFEIAQVLFLLVYEKKGVESPKLYD